MKAERWQQISNIYNSALELNSERRDAFLQEACKGDQELRREVDSLLACRVEAEGFLQSPALEQAAKALAQDQRQSPQIDFDPQMSKKIKLPRARCMRFACPPWWMFVLAAVFVTDSAIKTYCHVLGPDGFGFRLQPGEHPSVIASVAPGSTADRAGLKAGDVVLALDGQLIQRFSDWMGISSNLVTGRTYRLDIERDGQRQQVAYSMERVNIFNKRILILWQVDGLLLLATALLIGFCRPYDTLARIGALALATLSSSLTYWSILPPGYAAIWREFPPGVSALLWIPILCSYMVGPIILTFFVLFPRPLFRSRWPWAIIWLPALCFVPAYFHSTFLMEYRPLQAFGNLLSMEVRHFGARLYGLYGLVSVAALAVNYYRMTDTNDRRRLRVLFVGGAAGVLPGTFRLMIWQFAPLSAFWNMISSGIPNLLIVLVFVLFPASFAYSILRHRLLDIQVIIRQGIRYALARDALLAVVPVLGIILLADLLMHGDHPLIDILKMRGWIYAVLGGLAFLVYWQRKPWMEKLDRRFFREHYNAQQLLRGIIEEIREAKSFERVVPRVVVRIESALHPEFVSVVVHKRGEESYRTLASAPAGKATPPLAADSKIIALARMLGKPIEVLAAGSEWLNRHLPDEEIDLLRRARVDLLVPISGSAGGPEALLLLGMKRSEEPYTSEDQELLEAIAASLALLFDQTFLEVELSIGGFEECPQCGTCADSGSGRCMFDGTVLTPVTLPRILAGRYHLERRRGRGGMGTVYEATDRSLQRRVAVKVLREDWLHNAEAVKRFQGEARAAAAFAHPNVVTVYDFGVESGTHAFLVMELLEGATLRVELECERRLPAARTVEIFRSVCSAVDAAHRRDLIHRDLKPENIFLARSVDTRTATIKVLDFGIAKFLPASGHTGNTLTGPQTATGILIGTMGYMSPEQLLGEKPAVSWDLWALSVVAYEIVTGALPFARTVRDEWRQSVLAGKYTPLSEYLTDPPVSLQEFFADSLGIDRTRRPASATEFFRRLEQALA